MKKQALKNFTMLSLVLLLTAVSVSAQSGRSGVLKIPFNFIVGGKTLPAGDYTVERNRRDFEKVWVVQSRDGRKSVLFITMSVRANETPDKAKLVFHKYGDQYFLTQIWTPGNSTGRQILMPHLERKVAKNAPEHQRIVSGQMTQH